MIIKIRSNNDYLLDILYKNPNTDLGLYAKSLKNGVVIGNAISRNEYHVLFQDMRHSYLPEDSNQIDFQSFCNPMVAIDMCNDFFTHLLKLREEVNAKEISWLGKTIGEIDTMKCTIEIPTFYINSSWVKQGEFLLAKYMSGIAITHKVGHNYTLVISGESVFEAINKLSLVSLFTHITNDYGIFTFIDEQFAEKYARILTNLDDVPYFIFYLFIKRAVRAEKIFNAIKPVFETYMAANGLEVDFTWYPTHRARIKYITDRLQLDKPILDMGCGELQYYRAVMKLGFKKMYYAVDSDEKFQERAEKLSTSYEEDNLQFYTSLHDFNATEKINIILSEVIEHNSKEEAIQLIKALLKLNFEQIIITTPNSEFNVYYSETLEKRHEDHQFEPTAAEFKELIQQCIGDDKSLVVEYEHIGDKINGVQPTQTCIITKN